MQVKKTKMIFELFTNKISEFTFVSIFADMTIVNALKSSLCNTSVPILWRLGGEIQMMYT